MGLIWQEFKAIVSDAWDVIKAAALSLLKSIAEKYQLIIVLAVGVSASAFLIVTPCLAFLDLCFKPFLRIANPQYMGLSDSNNGFVFLPMFIVGFIVLLFTTELAERISKRLEGKAKDKGSEA